MKKMFCMLCCVAMVFSLVLPAAASGGYTDVAADAWCADAVDYVTENNLMYGVGNNEFAPDEAATRGTIVTILWRHAGAPANIGSSFIDVLPDSWYVVSASWGHINGIVEGYHIEGAFPGEIGYQFCFKGEQPITREELACFLYRYAKYAGADVSQVATLEDFADATTVSDWAVETMGWCTANGIIQGTPEGDDLLLAPSANATRAEVAAMLMRYCKLIEQ